MRDSFLRWLQRHLEKIEVTIFPLCSLKYQKSYPLYCLAQITIRTLEKNVEDKQDKIYFDNLGLNLSERKCIILLIHADGRKSHTLHDYKK